MEVIASRINVLYNSPVKIIDECESCFTREFHFHPEFELMYIKEGFGKRIIGNKIHEFKEGELLLIGPDVPHAWINAKSPYSSHDKKRSKAIVVYFNPQIFSELFYQMEEASYLNKLFVQSKYGVEIKGDLKEQIVLKLKNMVKAKGIDKIVQLLDILNQVSISNSFYPVNQQMMPANVYTSDRLTSLFNYIDLNYKKNISLKDAASVVNLSPESFCRYFKQRTGKNFINYLHEMRISNASQLLLNSDLTIAEVAYKNGFTTVSNFNKLFKKITGYRPTEYRKVAALV